MTEDAAARLPGLGEDQQLDPRSIPLQRIGAAIFSAVLAVVTAAAGLAAVSDSRTPTAIIVTVLLWLAANGLLAWHGQRWQAIDYRHTWYRVDGQGLEIRRGVFWRVVINVPRSRVQHTDVSQGPLERRYGLGTLVVYTAGTDHAKVTLSGLDYAVALRLREHLMPERGTDAV
jgi:membrane protein YdbS with pleckstrin-like domain